MNIQPDDHGRLCLQGLQLNGEIPDDVIESAGIAVLEVDVSDNALCEFFQLAKFPALRTLIADHNEVSSHTRWPVLPHLTTLWLNHNHVDNLPLFLENITPTFPNLKYLSMLGNVACPNFMNGGTPKQYQDYRLYVISQIPQIVYLDATEVTDEERAKSKMYAKTTTKFKHNGDFGKRKAPKVSKKKTKK